MERNLKLVIAYDGTDFHGWQRQPGVRTVQQVVEEAAMRVVRLPLATKASGRTDAGVHAVGQVANFMTTCDIPCSKLLRAIGSRLPEDAALVSVEEVSLEFHATISAVAKLYRYRIHNAAVRPVVGLKQRYCYHFWTPLDVDRMRAAAAHFVGTMDFSAMATVGNERRTPVRTVFRCDIEREDDEIRIDVEGSGFLYNQVRNMVGTLIDVGRGHRDPERVAVIMASRDRRNAGPTVPPNGLCLMWVKYPDSILKPVEPADCPGAPEPIVD